MFNHVVLNKYGYYTIKNKPTEEELKNYYEKKYYDGKTSVYRSEYSEEQIDYFNMCLENKLLLIKEHIKSYENASFLDIGCGEGFAVNFFDKSGFDVIGMDLSEEGIMNHNPEIVDKVLFGDSYKIINKFIEKNKTFNIINMDNVLEHVIDPEALLIDTFKILDKNGLLVIKVPNDYSKLQQKLFNDGIVSKEYWVCIPDHISYFNREGLINLCDEVGFKCVDFIGSNLVDFSLFNTETNYVENKELGKACYNANMKLEKLFTSISSEKTINLYRAYGELGLGRDMIGVFKK